MAFYFDNFDLRIATVRGHFLHLRTADTTDKYLTLSRYTEQIYDRECKHMIAQRKQQTDDQNLFLMGIILIYYVIASCNSKSMSMSCCVFYDIEPGCELSFSPLVLAVKAFVKIFCRPCDAVS